MPIFIASYIAGPSGVVDASNAAAVRSAYGIESAGLLASTAFALASHTHAASAITGLGSAATVSASTFAAASHTHGPTAIAGATTTGQVLISLTDGTFTSARLTAGSGVTLTHGSGSVTLSAGGGATSATAIFPAHSFFLAGTNSAGLVSIGDATTARVCLAFDDTTETYGYNIVSIPANLDSSGTVSFTVFGGLRSSTTGNLLWTFGERESANSESWTGAYVEYDSASTAISGATTTQREITWSVSVATLGWAAGDVVRFRVSRDPGVSGDATGDSLLDLFSITFPTA